MENSRPVYSTASGRLCPDCGQAVALCCCTRKTQGKVYADGWLRLKLASKGRKGKAVTCIEGLDLDQTALAQLASHLKNRCSCGGSVKNGIIEIQGDQRQFIQQLLSEQGYKSKVSGG